MIGRRVFCTVLLSLTLVFLGLGCSGHDHASGKKQFTLSARAKKTVRFKADHEARVSFKTDLTPSQRKKLKNNGIRLVFVDGKGEGEVVTSPDHGYVEAAPEKGKISVTLQNLESFPIKVTVTWK